MSSLIALINAHPEISLSLIEGTLSDLEKLYLSGAVNLYCTCDKTIGPDSNFLPVGEDRLVALIPSDDPLASKDVLTPSDFKDRNLLLPADIRSFYSIIDASFEEAGVAPKVVYRGAAVSSISLAQSGVGVTIMSRAVAEMYINEGLCIKDFVPKIKYEFGLGFRRSSELSDAEKEFLDYVFDYFSGKTAYIAPR